MLSTRFGRLLLAGLVLAAFISMGAALYFGPQGEQLYRIVPVTAQPAPTMSPMFASQPTLTVPTDQPTLAPTSTMAPIPTVTSVPTAQVALPRLSVAAATAMPAPTFEPYRPKIWIGGRGAIFQDHQALDIMEIRNTCYAQDVRSTVPITQVLDFGATARIKVYPPHIDTPDTFEDDGHVEAHIVLSLGNVVIEKDFVNTIDIPCLAAGRWHVLITGTIVLHTGQRIPFNNTGPETDLSGKPKDNQFRWLEITRGDRTTYGWQFEWY